MTVRLAVLLTPFSVAVIVTSVLAAVSCVVTVNVTVLSPFSTFALAGTVAAAPLLLSVTTCPAGGAGPASVIVPETVVFAGAVDCARTSGCGLAIWAGACTYWEIGLGGEGLEKKPYPTHPAATASVMPPYSHQMMGP